MTDELQKLIDSKTVVTADGTGNFYYMLHKSDVVELIEKLTKWHSVKDLPTLFKENILVKSEGKIIFCSYYGPMGFMQHRRNYIRGKAQGSEYQSVRNVTEWKSIT